MLPDYVTQLHDARRKAGHSCRSLGIEIGRTYETVSRVEREAKGNFETLTRIASALGYDLRLFTLHEGKLLTHGLDSEHLGAQLYCYRRGVIRKPRKAFIRPTLSLDAIISIEADPACVRFGSVEEYARALGLTIGLTKQLN
ncbi:MAG: hypothetical protein JNL45_12475 [Hyphomicrobium sp.]|nr:hypothetical protein [Hyphomicrobium sp.]